MIRQALDGKIGDSKEEKDRFLHEFCKLRAKHQELLNRNIQARRNLKQVGIGWNPVIMSSIDQKVNYTANLCGNEVSTEKNIILET